MSFTLTQLRHFSAIAETGQVSRAAVLCNIAQPSLSASLRNLENLLGDALFEREPRGLRLTPSGERFLRHARHILAAADEAAEDMRTEPDRIAGTVRIAVAETVSGFLLPALLRQAARELPHVSLDVEELGREAAEEKVLAGRIDLAIMIVSHLSAHEHIAYDILLRSPRRVWTGIGHPLLEKPAARLEDLAAYDYILLETDEHAHLVRQYWADNGFAPKVVFRSKSLECIRNLVGQGLGITILSDFLFRSWSHDGERIRMLPLHDPAPTLDIGIGHGRIADLSPSARRVLDMARQLLRKTKTRNTTA